MQVEHHLAQTSFSHCHGPARSGHASRHDLGIVGPSEACHDGEGTVCRFPTADRGANRDELGLDKNVWRQPPSTPFQVLRVIAILPILLLLSVAAHAETLPDKRAAIDRLLDALKAAPNEQAAAALESQLVQTWLHAGTPTVTLLMSRGLRSLQAGQDEEAVGSFSDAITLQPDVAEAWRQRALARYHAGDVNGAIHDLEQTVQLEPRDFAAFRTLTDIAFAREDWKGAYESWQKVMELDPKTPNGEERLRLLKRKAVGEDT
jgi:tetratricopeptide (TPR) repeat protein